MAQELAFAARSAVESLPLDEREAVCLCCEQGLAWEAAAKILGVPKQTLGNRVNRGLEKLRKILAQQGFEHATPVVISAALSALPLPSLSESLAATLQDIAADTAALSATKVIARSERTSGFFASKTVLWAIGFVLCSTVAVGGIWFRNAVSQSGGAVPDPEQFAPAPKTAPVERNGVFERSWTFEKGPPDDFRCVSGNWRWRRNPETQKGEMINFGNVAAIVVPPIRLPNQPFEVKFTVERMLAADLEYLKRNIPLGMRGEVNFQIVCDAYWEFTIEKNSWWARPLNLRLPLPACVRRVVFTGKHSIQYQDGNLYALMEYKKPYPNDGFSIVLKNCAISKIEVRTLREDEITEEMREPRKNIERFELTPVPMNR